MRGLALICVLVIAACGQTAAPPAPPAFTQTADAKPAQASARASTAWDRNLLALLPQIDACIARSPETRYVSFAGERDGGVLVRVRGAENAMDCRVRDGVAQISPRDETVAIDGENAAIFVRGPGENPGGERHQAPEVHSAQGALLG